MVGRGALDTWRISEEKYLSEIRYLVASDDSHARELMKLEKTIGERNTEISHLRSLEIKLKGDLHREAEARKVTESKIEGLYHQLSDFETSINVLQRRVDSAEAAQRLAESRVSDLQDALQVERARFDKAIEHERDVETGMRSRFGLIPKSAEGVQSGELKPISTRRQGWPQVQADLENKSRVGNEPAPVAQPENDAKASHWARKIAEVEEKDSSLNNVGNPVNSAQ